MIIEEEIIQKTVKVNQGSGFIVQPACDEFSYIFTARHNVQKNPEDLTDGLLDNTDIPILKIDNSYETGCVGIEVLEKYVSDDHDIAILIIPYQLGVSIYPCYKMADLDHALRLWGYPYYDQYNTDLLYEQINVLELKVHRNDGEILELRNESQASYEDVQGYSGGGVFSLSGSAPALVAIESKMSNAQAEHNHIKATPVFRFKQLINEKQLSQVYPSYLADFSTTHRNTFVFENCFNPDNLTKAKNRLQRLAQRYVEKGMSSPVEIIDELYDYLAVHNRQSSELENERLWAALLEVIVIKHLVDEKGQEEEWNVGSVRLLFDSIRFIFINSRNSWKRHLREILCTNVNSLKRNGIALLVLIGDQDLPDQPILDQRIFVHAEPDISRGLDGFPELIDLAESSPILTGDVKVVHLAKLHSKCFVDEEFQLRELDSTKATALLSQNYSAYIPKMEFPDE